MKNKASPLTVSFALILSISLVSFGIAGLPVMAILSTFVGIGLLLVIGLLIAALAYP